MDAREIEAQERRVRERARRLWEEEGRPKVAEDTYIDKARELIAIEDNADLAREPIREYTSDSAGREPVEEASIAEKMGDVPTLTDQGEERTIPSEHREPLPPPRKSG